MQMETKIDFSIKKPGIDTSISKEPFQMKFNPLQLLKYSYAEFTALVISEILKITYAHPASFAKINLEKDKKTHKRLEKSSNASVSNMVQHDIYLDKRKSKNLVLPKDMYTTTQLTNELGVNPKRDQALEYYYKVLKQFEKKQPEDEGDSDAGGLGQGGQDEGGVSTQNNDDGQEPHQWYDESAEDMSEKIKNMVSSVYNEMDEKSRGLMPGGLQEQIKKLLKKPEISWKQLLRKYVGAIPVPHRSTKTRLNRLQPERADLSGRLPKRHIEIVVGIDTSGSMSNSDIMYVMNEIFSIVKDYESKVTIIECDAVIGKIYTVKSVKDVQTKVSGRGGTYFTPVIDYINESGKYKNALMIYFTDGWGEDTIPKPRTLRNLWVVLQDESNLSVKQPYGEVKALRKDADWIKQNGG